MILLHSFIRHISGLGNSKKHGHGHNTHMGTQHDNSLESTGGHGDVKLNT